MKKFEINETNKTLWDKNFIKVEGGNDVQSCGDDGMWKQAEPLNNDPTIQEYGAINAMRFLKFATIHIVRVRFFLKLKRRDNTCNGNGYGIWSLDWAWFRKRGSKRLWTQRLGNGDNGERCEG